MASVHAHYRSERWHASGQVGAGHSQLWSRRTIDLGDAGEHLARSRRAVDQIFVHAEFGSELAVGAGRLGPFVAFDPQHLAQQRGHRTGRDRNGARAGPGTQRTVVRERGCPLCPRLGHGRDAVAVNLDARYQRRITADDAQYAAFVGTPDATFDLANWSRPAVAGVVNLGLACDIGRLWIARSNTGTSSESTNPGGGWFVDLRREL